MSMDDARGRMGDPEDDDTEIPDALLREPQMLELSDRDMDALLDAIANPLPRTRRCCAPSPAGAS